MILTRFLCCFFICLSTGYGTPQIPDSLIKGDKKLGVYGFSLPSVDEEDSKLQLIVSSGGKSSSCWRGYIATLELRGKELYLVALDTSYFEEKVSVSRLIGREIPKEGLPAMWFSGDLIFLFGSSYGYLHNSVEGDQLSRQRIFRFEKGVLVTDQESERPKPAELMTENELNELVK